MPQEILEWGIELIIWMQSLGNWLIVPMNVFTFTGYVEFYLLILPALYWCVEVRLGMRMGVLILLSVMINALFKMVIHDPRPYWVTPRVELLTRPESTFGIPSGHAQNAVVFWGLLAAYINKTWAWIVAAVLAFFVGVSRLYLGAHFPTDVLFGWLIGIVLLAAFLRWENNVVAWLQKFSKIQQIAFAFVVSIAFIVCGVLISLWGIEVPVEWVETALAAAPDAEIHPYSLVALLIGGGTLFGLACGIVLDGGQFDAGGKWYLRVGRYLVGLIGAVVLFVGLSWVVNLIAADESLLEIVLVYIQYSLIGAWVSYLAPVLFVKLKLAQNKSATATATEG